jgi:hypothetical protein
MTRVWTAFGSQESSVHIAMAYGLDGPVSIPGTLQRTDRLYPSVPGSFSLEVKRQGCVNDD